MTGKLENTTLSLIKNNIPLQEVILTIRPPKGQLRVRFPLGTFTFCGNDEKVIIAFLNF